MNMRPTKHDKLEWARLSDDAIAKGRDDAAIRFVLAASLGDEAEIPIGIFDRLQSEYRSWLIDGFVPNDENHKLRSLLEKAIPCIEAAEISLRAEGCDTAANKCLAVLKDVRVAICPQCGGTGGVDSGGQTPWGSPIFVPCTCTKAACTHNEMVERIGDKDHAWQCNNCGHVYGQ